MYNKIIFKQLRPNKITLVGYVAYCILESPLVRRSFIPAWC